MKTRKKINQEEDKSMERKKEAVKYKEKKWTVENVSLTHL